jgi:hypothetical protein
MVYGSSSSGATESEIAPLAMGDPREAGTETGYGSVVACVMAREEVSVIVRQITPPQITTN